MSLYDVQRDGLPLDMISNLDASKGNVVVFSVHVDFSINIIVLMRKGVNNNAPQPPTHHAGVSLGLLEINHYSEVIFPQRIWRFRFSFVSRTSFSFLEYVSLIESNGDSDDFSSYRKPHLETHRPNRVHYRDSQDFVSFCELSDAVIGQRRSQRATSPHWLNYFSY